MCFDILPNNSNPFTDEVDTRFASLDIRNLAKDVGLKPTENIDEFSKRLKAILDRFLADLKPAPIPKRNIALAQFAKLQKPTSRLLDALNEMETKQNYAWYILQDGYEASFPLDDEQIRSGDLEEGLNASEINIEQLITSLERLSVVIDEMRDYTAPGGAKGQKDRATHNVVNRLADFYEDYSKVPAYVGFTKLKKTDTNDSNSYDGPFFLFVEECISSFAPEHYRGNSSLGNIIIRAFKEHPR